jgi:hypothetical protein
MAQMA